MSARRIAAWMAFLALPAAVPMALSACQPVKPPAPPTVTVTACEAFGKIIVSQEDAKVISLPLLTAIHAHNLAYAKTCTTPQKN